jgi:hypothetical protein
VTDDAGVTATATAPVASPDDAPPGPAAGPRGSVTALFGATAFLASGLIFVVQPLIARTLLPVLGGSASVWNSAMLTFQVLLLGGYLLAHLGATRLPARWFPPASVALVLVATVALPVGLRDGWQPGSADPTVWTVLAVVAAVGGPFLALSSVSPTLQRWFGAMHPTTDAYVLYAAGNVGSFVGLLAYPLVIERVVGIADQRTWWTVGYVAFLALFATCATLARRAAGRDGSIVAPTARADRTVGEGAVPGATLARWAAMAAAPSLLLLGVTRHLSTDVAAVPLLWVIPLGIYLLTFVAAFSGRGAPVVALAGRLSTVLAAIVVISLVASVPAAPGLVLHLLAFTVLALAVHGRLASERPPVASLTSFYLAISFGGAVGGVIGGLVAPLAFEGIYEYPLGIVACAVWLVPTTALAGRARVVAGAALGALLVVAAVLRTTAADADGPARGVQLVLGGAAIAMLATCRRGWQVGVVLAAAAAVAVAVPGAATIAQERSYYGVTRVVEDADGWRLLISGTTVHGAQDPSRPDVPLTYYAPGGPLADLVATTGAGDTSIGVVGLGAGSMAAWLDAGDELTFYEIDPVVIDLATDPDVYTFIDDSAGSVRIVDGDGRLSLAAAPAGGHDLIVIDAFSSDAIPAHLLTREALATYRTALADDGVVGFHVSNRYFDLLPVVARLAEDAGLDVVARHGIGDVPGALVTTAVAVGTPAALDELHELGWETVAPGGALWTDDHADVLGALSSLSAG